MLNKQRYLWLLRRHAMTCFCFKYSHESLVSLYSVNLKGGTFSTFRHRAEKGTKHLTQLYLGNQQSPSLVLTCRWHLPLAVKRQEAWLQLTGSEVRLIARCLTWLYLTWSAPLLVVNPDNFMKDWTELKLGATFQSRCVVLARLRKDHKCYLFFFKKKN